MVSTQCDAGFEKPDLPLFSSISTSYTAYGSGHRYVKPRCLAIFLRPIFPEKPYKA